MLLETTIIIYHNRDLISPFKPPQPVIVYLLHVTQTVTVEINLHEFEKLNFMREERILVFLSLAGEMEALLLRNDRAILPMLIKPGELTPVNLSLIIRFSVEHI